MAAHLTALWRRCLCASQGTMSVWGGNSQRDIKTVPSSSLSTLSAQCGDLADPCLEHPLNPLPGWKPVFLNVLEDPLPT